MRYLPTLLLSVLLAPALCAAADPELRAQAEASLQRGLAFFRTLHVHGGYGYHATPDGRLRWGESLLTADEIEVQPPGTPAVGQSFLRAYRVTRDPQALTAAWAAGQALIRGQNQHGGWNHTIDFAKLTDATVSFDDNQSQSAISFLMALDQEIDDPTLTAAIERALELMVRAQLPSGGWPHMYPERGNYHDFATFNDGGINDCIRVMIEARRLYPDHPAVARSLRRAARFMQISQLPPPQPGWAQQYNEYLQPAWARSFEPPSVCPAVTVRNLQTLVDLFLVLRDATLLEPIPDSLRWLREIRLANGKWARFVELGTNQPLYYDRGRVRVASIAELHVERGTGYAYETDLAGPLEAAARRYEQALQLGATELAKRENAAPTAAEVQRRLQELAGAVRDIIATQDASGAWITRHDRFRKTMPRGVRWNGEYESMDRINSAVFNRHVATLCEYLELAARPDRS